MKHLQQIKRLQIFQRHIKHIGCTRRAEAGAGTKQMVGMAARLLLRTLHRPTTAQVLPAARHQGSGMPA